MPEENKIEALCARIIDDAKSEAKRISDEAVTEVGKIVSMGDARIEQLHDEYEKKRAEQALEIKERSRMNAQLEGRKLLLKKKREILDSVYEKAYTELLNLKGDERYDLLIGLLKREALGDEHVLPAKSDAKLIEKAVEELNSKDGMKLKVGRPISSFDGGFLLRSKDFDKNCSLSALIDEARQVTEMETAELLFG
ncbi:MAG: V-type ATP synthase subunit E [Clostridia bacterium]|nr:V-type ATP synthase subunit E [Clostridia bacterium]